LTPIFFIITDDSDVKGAKKTCIKSNCEDLINTAEKQYIYTDEDAEELLESKSASVTVRVAGH
jgi:hypothetical protein